MLRMWRVTSRALGHIQSRLNDPCSADSDQVGRPSSLTIYTTLTSVAVRM